MPKHSQPRRGSMQFWPRKRASKILPSVNWNAVPKDKKGILGFIGYKVAMDSAVVKDNTEHSLTKGQRKIIPVTFLECPPMKILSLRFYKDHQIVKETYIGADKEMKKRVKVGKRKDKVELETENYDEIRAVVYSIVNKTSIKKSPDIAEVAFGGSKAEQLETAKSMINREISITEAFSSGLVDIRAVTKGKGLQGPMRRFGISKRFHKSEKGVRKVGSIGPWHPARIMYTVPMAGQTGYFTRVVYNSKIVLHGKTAEKDLNPKEGFKAYGKIKTDYLIMNGSVNGPSKRAVLLTAPIRPTKKQNKKNMEFISLAK